MNGLRRYHAAVWDEPLVMELTRKGRRGLVFPEAEAEVRDRVGDAAALVPAPMRRAARPDLPELSEPDVLRHYLHLAQETLGMMGISLFGTCTMKYNPRLGEALAARPELSELHPHQDDETLQGVLALVHGFDEILCGLSGMERFVFQAGGGAHASYTFACLARAHHASRGELDRRDEVITTIQAHPCNAATAAAAGFKVVTLMLGDDGYPPVEALRAAVSDRTAALMVNNPDDMGIYNPHIDEWVRIVHEAGGLCFYDHANFNGVMGRVRARDLGFDACMYMLHKTFGAPKGGGGPAVGAIGCTGELARFLPTPVVERDGDRYRLDDDRPESIGKVREFWGNVPQVVKAYAWARAMGAEGIREAADLSVLANNYLERRLLEIPGDHALAPRDRRPSARDDPLQPRRAAAGDGHRRRRRLEPAGRLRRRRALALPRALDRPGADHARGGRDVVEGGHRLLDRGARPGLPRGPRGPRARPVGTSQPGRPQARRRLARRPRRLGDHLARLPAEGRASQRGGARGGMTDLAGRAARSSASGRR